MDNQIKEPKKLLVKKSNFQTNLTFNEWVEKYNVSMHYSEPTKYFQGNPNCGIPVPKKSFFQEVREYFETLLS